MTARNNKRLLLSLPFAAIFIALLFLALFEAGAVTFGYDGRSPLRKVTFSCEMLPLEEYASNTNLILVSEDHPVPQGYPFDIVFYRDTDVPMNSAITEDYGRMSDYVREEMGDHLYVSSSYRSYEDQERVYNEEGPDVAALPGCSEHQTGLALDVYAMYHAGAAFPDSQVGRFVIGNCSQFGFIIRYPEGAEDITGFSYEPWHIRYVGLPHSEIITSSHITLEEYIDLFEIGTWYACEDYYMARLPEDDLKIPEELAGYDITVSPDNTGYAFITVYTG
jgi:D-alanyl-D-alanine carboxypeptidase